MSGFAGDIIAHAWTTSFGQTSEQKIELDADNQTRTVTAINPDGSSSVTVIVDGRTETVTTYDATTPTPVQLSKITYTYDAHGRVESTADAYSTSGGGGETEYTYDDADRVTAVTTPDPDTSGSGDGLDPQTTEYDFDALGRQVKITHPDEGETHFTYYPTGQLKKTWGTRAYPIEYTYTDQGQLATMTTWQDHPGSGTPSGSAVTTWHYSANRGLLTSKEYNNGKGPSYTYTPGGRLLTRTWARLDGVSPLVTTYDYDAAGQLIEIDYSDTTPDVAHTYNRRGQIAQTIDAAGTRVYTYNDAGQVLTEGYTAGVMEDLGIVNVYDSHLRRQSLTGVLNSAELFAVEYTYDAASRLATVGSDGGGIAAYTYTANAPNLVASVTFNNGVPGTPGDDIMVTSKAYDLLGRLTLIKSHNAATPATVYSSHSYQFNDANQRTKATMQDASYWSYEYDSLGQLTSGKRYWSNDTPVAGQQFTYGYDDIGNRLATSAGGDHAGANLRNSTYTPNLLNQITQRTVPGYIDVLGTMKPSLAGATVEVNSNPAYQTGSYFRKELAVSNTADPILEYIEIEADLASASYTENREKYVPETPEIYIYDDEGNLLSDGHFDYTWDAENRLVKLETIPDAVAVMVPDIRLEFIYDSLGRRIQKELWFTPPSSSPVLAMRTRFLYDGWNMVGEVGATSGLSEGLWRAYAWGLDISGSEQGGGGAGGLLFLFRPVILGLVLDSTSPNYDGNGNVVALVQMSAVAPGDLLGRYTYDPYGNELDEGGPVSDGSPSQNPFRYSTKYKDELSGLYYFGHRYYSPGTGNWLSRDPIEEQDGVNIYGYVRNEPVSSIDVNGLWRYVEGMGLLSGSLQPGREKGPVSAEFSLTFWPDREKFKNKINDTCCKKVEFFQIYYFKSYGHPVSGVVQGKWTLDAEPQKIYYPNAKSSDPRNSTSQLHDIPGATLRINSLEFQAETCAVCSESLNKNGEKSVGDVYGCIQWGFSLSVRGASFNRSISAWKYYVGSTVWSDSSVVTMPERSRDGGLIRDNDGNVMTYQLGGYSGRRSYNFSNIEASPPSAVMSKFLDKELP